jgi:dolichol-phosphate mannosyltransferase
LSIAEGATIVMLDGDLQDPPELIKDLYEKLQSSEDLDVVYAKRNSRKETVSRGLFTSLFHKIFKRILRSESIDNVGNYAIFRSTVKDAMLAYSEKTRYLPGIRVHVGFNQVHILFDRDERFAGKTKMSFSRLFSLSLDAIFSFSNFPIRLMLIIGVGGLFISFLGIIYIIISKLSGIAPFGWSSTVMFILFFGSLQLAFMGILGEYVHRIYKESQNRPLFIVKNIIQ